VAGPALDHAAHAAAHAPAQLVQCVPPPLADQGLQERLAGAKPASWRRERRHAVGNGWLALQAHLADQGQGWARAAAVEGAHWTASCDFEQACLIKTS
jgi:hypothetical protein